MKKALFSTLFSLIVLFTIGQDLKSIKKAYDKNDLNVAKAQIDEFVTKNPLNAEALYLESKIYNAVSTNEQLKNTFPEARMTAFEAFKKSLENSKGNNEFLKMMITDAAFYKPLIEMYSGYYDGAAAAFNLAASKPGKTNKPDFEQAMKLFINADKVGNYIAEQKLGLSALDTNLILNIGKAALNAGKNDVALTYFSKLADANVKGTKDGIVGYDLPYQWLTLNYKNAKDEANMLKYATLGRQLYPKDDYYDAVILDFYRDKKDRDALFKQYQVITNKYPDSLSYHFNYANDAFNYIYNGDDGGKIANKAELLNTINTELSKANKINPSDVNTNWLFGQYHYNHGVDIKEQVKAIKGATPADVKMKSDLNLKAAESFNNAIPYVEKAMATLEVNFRKADKSRYKSISDLMQRIYSSLQKNEKVKIYQAKYDTADTKFIN